MTLTATVTALPKMIGYAEMAELTGLSRKGLEKAIAARRVPAPIKFGHRTARWSIETVLAWLRKKEAEAGYREDCRRGVSINPSDRARSQERTEHDR